MPATTRGSLGRRAFLGTMVVGGLATVGSIYSKTIASDEIAAHLRDEATSRTRQTWESHPDEARTAQTSQTVSIGSILGFLYIPRLRDQVWGYPIIEGTNPQQLKRGVGHLRQTALPGIDGNVALFGHRTSYGRPFDNFDELTIGDKVVVETLDSWHVYTLAVDQKVDPGAVWVAKPNPFLNGNVTGQLPFWKIEQRRLITLITCTPKYSTAMRWVWWGTQTDRHRWDDPPSIVADA